MPISVNRTLGAHDRCSPDGAVIAAYLSAVVEGDTIIGWLENSGFTVQEVQLDGTLAPLDIAAAALALQAGSADMEAAKAGVVGISSLIADRRIRAFSEKAESEGDSHAGTNMIQASCWEEASMDGEAVFGGLACTRNRRG